MNSSLVLKDVSFGEIMKICGILDANCFRIDRNGTRGLFLATSMINHDCLPNARIIFNDKGKLLNFFEAFFQKECAENYPEKEILKLCSV